MSGRWLLVVAVVTLVGVPVALMGLYATGDLCPPTEGLADRRGVDYDGYENVIETLVVRCTGEDRSGAPVETTQVNWTGGGAALLFLVGLFFAAAGAVEVIARRRAAVITGACALGVLGLTLVWFA